MIHSCLKKQLVSYRKPTVRPSPIYRMVSKHSKKQSAILDSLNIVELDEDEDGNENRKPKSDFQNDLTRSLTSISLPTTKKEVIIYHYSFHRRSQLI